MTFFVDDYREKLRDNLFGGYGRTPFRFVVETPSFLTPKNLDYYHWMEDYIKCPKAYYNEPLHYHQNTIILIINKKPDYEKDMLAIYPFALLYVELIKNPRINTKAILDCFFSDSPQLPSVFDIYFFPKHAKWYYVNGKKKAHKDILVKQKYKVIKFEEGMLGMAL